MEIEVKTATVRFVLTAISLFSGLAYSTLQNLHDNARAWRNKNRKLKSLQGFNPVLDVIILAAGILSGLIGGYLANIAWNKAIKDLAGSAKPMATL